MRRDTTEFRNRFLKWKNGELVYENGLVSASYRDGRESEIVTSYPIPFIEDKAVTLTNAGLATGARLSTNLLDTLANNAVRANLPVKTAIGLATKESTLGNPTDDRSMRTLLSKKHQQELIEYLEERYGLPYEKQFGQHINYGDEIHGQELINYWRGTVERKPSFLTTSNPDRKSVVLKALEDYKRAPHKYNPGQKNYSKLVDKRAEEVWRSPEIQKWYKDWEAKQIRVMRPALYNLPTIQSTAPEKFGKYQDGKENESEFPFGDQWLKEVTVYPTTLSLQTHYPIVSRYLPGHSVLLGNNENTGDHFIINKRPNNPGYNFVTNNCSDDTRKALEAATGNMIRPFLFTTPGDVLDFFRQQYPDFKERKSRNGVKTLTANVSPIEFSRAKEIADSLSDINREKRRQDLKRWYQEALRRRVSNKDSLYQDGKESSYAKLVIEEQKANNERERNIAKSLVHNPSLPNLFKSAYHWYKSVPFLGGQSEVGIEPVLGMPPDIQGIKNVDKLIKVAKISKAIGDAIKSVKSVPKITTINASKITPAQWTAAQDAAIVRGDMAEAQRLRDLHFATNAPNTVIKNVDGIPAHVYHGTFNKGWNSYDKRKFGTSTDNGMYGEGLYATSDRSYADVYARGNNADGKYIGEIKDLYVNGENPFYVFNKKDLSPREIINREDAAYQFGRTLKVQDDIPTPIWDEMNNSDIVIETKGTKRPNFAEIVVPRGEQIKSADAVTYNNKGVRIPLGERDNFSLNDIRYGLLPFVGIGATAAVASQKNQSDKSKYLDGKEARYNKYETSFAQPINYEDLIKQDPLGYHGKEAGALLGRIHALKKLEEQTGPIDFYDPNKRKGSRMKKKLYNVLYNSGGIVPWPTDPDMDYTGSYWYNSGNADVESNWRIFKKSSEYGGRNAVKQRNLLDMYVYKEPTGLKYLRDDSYVLGGDTLYKGPYYEGKIYPLGSDSVYNITKYAKPFIDSLISKNLTIPVNLNNLPLDRNRFPELILDNVRHAKLKPVVDEKGNYYFKASKLWDLSGSLTFGNTVDKVNKLLGGSPFVLEQKIPIRWDNDDLHEYNTDWNYIKKTIVDPNNDTGYKYGKESGIHIKPSHRGRLTALKKRTGKSEAELYKNGSAAVRKMITFARNARKWKH